MGYRTIVAVLAIAGILAGCSTDVTATAEYAEVASARDQPASEADRLASELTSEQERRTSSPPRWRPSSRRSPR